MKHENLLNRYKKLENTVLNTLRTKINKSRYISKHVQEKAIKVNVFDYTELTIINDELTFLDCSGYHYSLYSECSLEDLIDILTKS